MSKEKIDITTAIEKVQALVRELASFVKDANFCIDAYNKRRVEINLRSMAILCGCPVVSMISTNKKGVQEVKFSMFKKLPDDIEKIQLFAALAALIDLEKALMNNPKAVTGNPDIKLEINQDLIFPVTLPEKLSAKDFEEFLLDSCGRYLSIYDFTNISLYASALRKWQWRNALLIGGGILLVGGITAGVLIAMNSKGNNNLADETQNDDCDYGEEGCDGCDDPIVTIEDDSPVVHIGE
jgi:hypothetical protein